MQFHDSLEVNVHVVQPSIYELLARIMFIDDRHVQFQQLIQNHIVPDTINMAQFMLTVLKSVPFQMGIAMLSRLGQDAAVLDAFNTANKVRFFSRSRGKLFNMHYLKGVCI